MGNEHRPMMKPTTDHDSGATPSLEGRYANYFEVGHNAVEIVLVFGQFYTADEHPLVHTRIITSPQRAAALLETLKSSLESYQMTFGPIFDPPESEGWAQ